MMPDRIMKASDVFRESQPLIGRKVSSMEEAFPMISELKIEMQELNPYGGTERNGILDKNELGEFVNCSNHKCYGGGFQLGSIIRGMISQNQTESAVTQSCRGYEGSPKGRRNYGVCGRWFKIKVHIKYKEVLNSSDKT